MSYGTYIFDSTLWIWRTDKAPVAWHFLTLPEDTSDVIKELHSDKSKGFGSIKVNVTIGETKWSTSLFPQSETECYILPVKAAVRKAENIAEDDDVSVKIEIVGY